MAVDPDVQKLIDQLAQRIEVLERGGTVYIPPDRIIQVFPDETVVTYEKK